MIQIYQRKKLKGKEAQIFVKICLYKRLSLQHGFIPASPIHIGPIVLSSIKCLWDNRYLLSYIFMRNLRYRAEVKMRGLPVYYWGTKAKLENWKKFATTSFYSELKEMNEVCEDLLLSPSNVYSVYLK